MSDTLLGNITVEEVPAPVVEKRSAIATIGKVTTRAIANGYVQVAVPLSYPENGKERSFTARWNVRPEWFTTQFSEQVKAGDIEPDVQYRINFSGLTRGIFKATGLTGALDFARLEGLKVGFATRVRKDDDGEQREDIGRFYPPERGKKVATTPATANQPSEL